MLYNTRNTYVIQGDQ